MYLQTYEPRLCLSSVWVVVTSAGSFPSRSKVFRDRPSILLGFRFRVARLPPGPRPPTHPPSTRCDSEDNLYNHITQPYTLFNIWWRHHWSDTAQREMGETERWTFRHKTPCLSFGDIGMVRLYPYIQHGFITSLPICRRYVFIYMQVISQNNIRFVFTGGDTPENHY